MVVIVSVIRDIGQSVEWRGGVAIGVVFVSEVLVGVMMVSVRVMVGSIGVNLILVGVTSIVVGIDQGGGRDIG